MQRITVPGATQALDLAADKVGGFTALATALHISRAAVLAWRQVPAGRVLAVERITGVSRSVLRPDLYPTTEAP